MKLRCPVDSQLVQKVIRIHGFGIDAAEMQEAEVRGVQVVLQPLQPVIFLLDHANLDVALGQVVELEIGEWWRCFAAAHIDPDRAPLVPRRIGPGFHLVFEILMGWHGGHVQAIAVHIVLPAVIDTTDAALFVAAKEERGAAVRAAVIHDADAARGVAKGDQLFAKRQQPQRIAVGLNLVRAGNREPILTHHLTHGRAWTNTGQ